MSLADPNSKGFPTGRCHRRQQIRPSFVCAVNQADCCLECIFSTSIKFVRPVSLGVNVVSHHCPQKTGRARPFNPCRFTAQYFPARLPGIATIGVGSPQSRNDAKIGDFCHGLCCRTPNLVSSTLSLSSNCTITCLPHVFLSFVST